MPRLEGCHWSHVSDDDDGSDDDGSDDDWGHKSNVAGQIRFSSIVSLVVFVIPDPSLLHISWIEHHMHDWPLTYQCYW